jgi:hypothetical protein
VGLAITREAALAGALLFAVCVLAIGMSVRHDEALDLEPELLIPTFFAALLMPWAVWKGDPVFGRAYLWTIPASRQQAALAKVAAGALWLMLAMLVTLAALAVVPLATGGTIGEVETRLVETGAGGLETAQPVRWSTPFWMWLAPFGGALTLYVFGSAALLGLRHPVRWLVGLAATGAFLFALALNLGAYSGLEEALDRFLSTMIEGRYGLDFMLTGGEGSLSRDVRIPGEWPVYLWTSLPSAERWFLALLVWFGGALLALALAIRRHWER